MWETRKSWALLLSACLLTHYALLAGAEPPPNALEAGRQAPLSPLQFSLAATRFIVMLPFLPLLMAVPGLTSVVMPLFLAMQDRLKTILPNLPNIVPGSNTASNSIGSGIVSNSTFAYRKKVPPPQRLRKRSAHLGERLKMLFPFLSPRRSAQISDADAVTTRRPILKIKRPVLKLPHHVVQEGVQEIFELMHKTDDVINQLTSSQPDCRRQAVCRLHYSIDPDIGSFLGNVMNVLKLDSQIDKIEVSDTTRRVVKDVLQAANTGLGQQDCVKMYSRCSVTVDAGRP